MAGNAVISATIPPNEALSSEIDLGGFNLIGIQIPASFNGTTITFQGKTELLSKATVNPHETYYNIIDDTGTELSLTVAASRIVVIGTTTKAAIGGLRRIRIRSGTSAAPVNQVMSEPFLVIGKEMT